MSIVTISSLTEKPKSCADCPVYNYEYGCSFNKSWNGEADFNNCPLTEYAQPNPFNSVVGVLRDFDIQEEPYIYDLAETICQLFKCGPYDIHRDYKELVK